jgi:hypothetical protein
MNAKLSRYDTYDGHCCNSSCVTEPLPAGGILISRIRRVMAIAKTPSENASMRAVSVVTENSRRIPEGERAYQTFFFGSSRQMPS